jgi:transcription termination factor Rho
MMHAKLRSSPLIQKTKILRPLSQATAHNHPNVFIFVLLLPEGQAGEAWEPSKNGAHLPSQ